MTIQTEYNGWQYNTLTGEEYAPFLSPPSLPDTFGRYTCDTLRWEFNIFSHCVSRAGMRGNWDMGRLQHAIRN